MDKTRITRLEPLEFSLYEPHPDKPGMLRDCGSLTAKDAAEAISALLPHHLLDNCEYFGSCHSITASGGYRIGAHTPLDEGKYSFIAHWKPGANEGYFVEVSAVSRDDQRMQSLWRAKMFDAATAIELHASLMRILFCDGQHMDGILDRVSAFANDSDAQSTYVRDHCQASAA